MKEHQENSAENKARQKVSNAFQPKGPRDGYDNTGTQGYDSLKDDGYTGSTAKPANTSHKDGTGSSSEDFHATPSEQGTEEDEALDKGL